MRFDNRTRVSTYLSAWMPTGDSRVSVAGYFAGGSTASTPTSQIDKIAFPSDTKTTLSATLTYDVRYPAGLSNSGVAGYNGGGYSNGQAANQSGIDKIAFPSDTKTTLSATLTYAVQALGSVSDSGVAGYFAGGTTGTVRDNIDKIVFSSDTKSTLVATLTSTVSQVQGMANYGVAGYLGGGYSGAGSYLNRIDKLTFSAETKSTLAATLSNTAYSQAGMADSGVAGYFGGGYTGSGELNEIDKITFPADTKTTLAATLSSQRGWVTGMADSGVAGYFGGGGEAGGATYLTAIDKITFPADTKTTLSATLTQGKYGMAGFADCGGF